MNQSFYPLNKKLFLGVSFVLFTLLLSAKTKPIYGFFITTEHDTIECKFDIPFYKTNSGDFKLEFRDIQYKIKGKTKDGVKLKVTPDKYIGYGFAFNYKEFNYRTVDNTLSPKGKKIFVRIDIDGQLKLISHFVKIPMQSTHCQSGFYIDFEDVRYRRFYLQKENGDAQKLNKSFFKNELPALIADYPELVAKLGGEDYDYDNIVRVIMEYNEYWLNATF